MPFWSVAQTKPNREKMALRNLKRQGYEAFFPFFLKTNRHKHLVVEPLFRSYVFIRLDDDLTWAPINSTYGVSYLLTHADVTSARSCASSQWSRPFLESAAARSAEIKASNPSAAISRRPVIAPPPLAFCIPEQVKRERQAMQLRIGLRAKPAQSTCQ
jgi:hypothetical protein